MDIVRAWKEPQYRAGVLAADPTAELPAHPAGVPGLEQLDIAELDAVDGAKTEWITTFGCCNWYMTLTGGTTILPCTSWTICY